MTNTHRLAPASCGIGDRIGGAPISWGVCEAPGWGHELPPTRVLPEMAQLGLRAVELGPTGYLGSEPGEVRAQLAAHELRLIGGFLPVPMHIDAKIDLSEADAAMATLAAAGADVVVLAARSTDGSYDNQVTLRDAEWDTLFTVLDRLGDHARAHGLTPTLHPHVGTAVEKHEAVLRLLEGSDIPLCLDTGHLLIGGTDSVALLGRYADRVAHVQIKDVRLSVAKHLVAGELSFIEAVRNGLFTPLGKGDLDIRSIVAALESAGYQGWYVLEQDCALYGEPPTGTGPINDVRTSIEYLTSLELDVRR